MSDRYAHTDNYIQPFQLESSNLRGRYVRFGSTLDTMLAAHAYPYPVAHLTAETLILSTLLSSMLKYEGIFTLQATGDGPVSMLVADMLSNGDVRACAHYDPARFENARQVLSALTTPEGSDNHLAEYLGKGTMVFSVDHEGRKDRYQGVVSLEGPSLVACAQHYFTQSEQIQTGIKIAAGLRDGVWRGAGVMLQALPEDHGGVPSNVKEDDWRRAMILMGSVTEEEMLDSDLQTNEILLRLFHEEGVRVYDPQPLQKSCRCSQDRVERVLGTLRDQDKKELVVDGAIEVKCEFCSTIYRTPLSH